MSLLKPDGRVTRHLSALSALDFKPRPLLFAKLAARPCRNRFESRFPSQPTRRHSAAITAMPKKLAPITSATHRLSLELAKPHPVVWKGFTRDVHLWWPKD